MELQIIHRDEIVHHGFYFNVCPTKPLEFQGNVPVLLMYYRFFNSHLSLLEDHVVFISLLNTTLSFTTLTFH